MKPFSLTERRAASTTESDSTLTFLSASRSTSHDFLVHSSPHLKVITKAFPFNIPSLKPCFLYTRSPILMPRSALSVIICSMVLKRPNPLAIFQMSSRVLFCRFRETSCVVIPRLSLVPATATSLTLTCKVRANCEMASCVSRFVFCIVKCIKAGGPFLDP